MYYFYNNFFTKIQSDQKKVKYREQNIEWPLNLNDLFVSEKTLETHTLPIKIKTYDLNLLDIKKIPRGGICAINKKVFFFYNNKFYLLNENNLYKINIKFLSQKNIVTSLACTKDKKDNIVFFINTTEPTDKKKFSNKIIKGEIIQDKISNYEILVDFQTSTQNYAGKITLLNQEKLFLSFSSPYDLDDPENNKKTAFSHPSQDRLDIRGKIMLIDINSKKSEIFSLGHRNPQGLFLDNEKNLFSTEHGPYGGDELNLILSNKNYGWPVTSNGTSNKSYNSFYGKLGRHSSSFQKPIYSWTPGLGISDLLKLKNFDESWNGDLIITSLKNKSIYRVRLNNINNNYIVKYIETIFIGDRIRFIQETQNKKIYLITDGAKFIEISKVKKEKNKYIDVRGNVCLNCHHLGITNETHSAPSLVGIFNRKAGTDPNFQYSKAFDNIDFRWNKTNMIDYLLDPQKFLPGTTKSFKLKDSKDGIKLIDELSKIKITSK
ncbi:PQQ-dependent sugar dehydrogenase, partial [Candidatus Pelagibacter bacterium]